MTKTGWILAAETTRDGYWRGFLRLRAAVGLLSCAALFGLFAPAACADEAVSESGELEEIGDISAGDPAGDEPLSATGNLVPQTAVELVKIRAKFDQDVWSDEVLAQAYERTFVRLWDQLLQQSDKFGVLRDQEFDQLIVGTRPAAEQLDLGIESIRLTGPTKVIRREEWSDWLADFQLAGFEIVETEWHHQSFDPARDGTPAKSKVSFLIHAANEELDRRYVIRGNLGVTWAAEPSKGALATAGTIDATDLTILTRQGEPGFHEQWVEIFPLDMTGRRGPSTIHPVHLQDLNDDGLPEIVVSGFNRVYWNRGNWQFDPEPLCEHFVRHSNAAIFADFTGDGVTDYLMFAKSGYPHLYVGEPGGKFTTEPRVLDFSPDRIMVPTALTAGDIDGDGDLDVFLGQQKPGYHNGDMPTPYFNALDSFPGFLLINDGSGNFTDATEERGLGEKRHRRMFSASFVDLEGDGDLDLLTTSDFSGTDLFENDGNGYFTDVSDHMTPKGYAFGMSHTFGDYNLDGNLDFMLIGMSSTTARRLEHMQLGREDFPEHNEARMLMGYGNRMYLGDGRGRFTQAPFNDTVARTGWSWGSTTFDFDNDADPDVFICNGQISGQTTQDYCTRFWCHDIYYHTGERPEAAIRDLFQKMAPLFNGHYVSWNGYEHNALLMNRNADDGFVNMGYLMGVAHEFDARTCLTGDVDGDGRVDLISEQFDARQTRSRLFFLRNELETSNSWIGFHLRSNRPDVSPLGATITLELPDGRKLVGYNLSGHSVWAQHANAVHFGLGGTTGVQRASIRWPNGEVTQIASPEPGRYHVVTPPGGEERRAAEVSLRD